MKNLLSDTTRGATSIFKDSLRLFLSYPDEEIVIRVTDESKQLKNHFNSMGVFYHLLNKIRLIRNPTELRTVLNQLQSSLDKNQKIIAKTGGEHLPFSGTVLTISNSSMVARVIKIAHSLGKNLKILCLRSAPVHEGELFANSLKNEGLDVEVIEDNSVENRIKEVDVVLLGCDLLGKTYFINKRGSGLLVKYAGKLNKSVLVVTDLQRYVEEEIPEKKIDPVFEKIPYSNQINIICEKGVFPFTEFINKLLN